MNTKKLEFLIDRAAILGEKLASKLSSGKIPGVDELAFFDAAIMQLSKMAPAHALRVLAMQLHADVAAARAKRDLWLKGRDAAVKAAAEAQFLKAHARTLAKVQAAKRSQRPARPVSNAVAKALVAEMKAAVPTGTTKQGLPFVNGLPAEWANAEVA